MGMGVADCEFHVLAVDDSLIDRKLIERLLKTSSFQVTTVDSGSKALEFLGWHEHEDGDVDGDGERESNSNETSVSPKNHEEVEINLVITDYCMPGMTGYDLLKKMKESSYLRNIPVVIMSSENVPSRITRCLEEGAEEFFLKPVRLSDVNKLRPHMMKTKNNNIIIEKMENDEEEEDDDSSPSTSTSGIHHLQTTQSLNNNNNNGNSKRKSMDEAGLPLDITRPRYNGGLTVLSN